MSHLDDDIRFDTPGPRDQNWFGFFAANVTDFTHPAFVILPEFDEKLQFGPCKWQSRDATTLPAKGDTCVIVFDNRKQPWVVAWWPF